MTKRYVIIGAGPTGHHAALELRRLDSESNITLVSEERDIPYDRPPLSKDILTDENVNSEKLRLLRSGSYADHGIELVTQSRIIAIDRSNGLAISDSGKHYLYDRLLIATGSVPRRLHLSGSQSVGEYLRTLEDARRLREVISHGGKLVVIGGGFIGLEIAAAARSRGCDVTLIEASRTLLKRGMPSFVGDWALRTHQQRGVSVKLSACVTQLERLPDRQYAITVDEEVLRADAVSIGIGVVPNICLASKSGLKVADGIVVDEFCATSDPRIYAAGEVTRHPYGPNRKLRRIESWRTSIDHGVTAARNMADAPTHFANIPWFWSDQYDCNIQSVGFPDEATQYNFVEDSTDRTWTLVALGESSEIVGAVSVNRGRDIAVLKRAMKTGSRLPESVRLSKTTHFPCNQFLVEGS